MGFEESMEKLRAEVKAEAFLTPTEGFSGKDAKLSQQIKRMQRASKDFWYFDKVYFPPQAHRQGYSKPGHLHKRIVASASKPGIHWHLAHRDLAKTAYGLKVMIWKMLTGGAPICGTYAEDLRKARLLMTAVKFVMTSNPRLSGDYKLSVVQDSQDMLSVRSDTTNKTMYVLPFSQGRPVRGNNVHMDRPDFILADDLETSASSFKEEANSQRLDKIIEAWKSMRTGGTMLMLGNNLHPKCLANKLLKEAEDGIQREHIYVYPNPDWSHEVTQLVPYKGSVWPEKYPATSEAHMRSMRMIVDDVEWSQAQCKPQAISGIIFPKELFREYDKLPDDARGPAYVDPNLSLKGKGDHTAFCAVLFSPLTQLFYVHRPHIESYSDPNKLLWDYLSILDGRVTRLGMDGNVSQESNWSNFIIAWSVQNQRPYPPVTFCHYTVDQHSSVAQTIYHGEKLVFPKGFKDTTIGEQFLEEFHGFAGKKAGKPDDAPDAIICALALGYEQFDYPRNSGIFQPSAYEVTPVRKIFKY